MQGLGEAKMTETVLVVGAGPVGLTMAASLKRLGLPVRIVERATARSDKSKALVLWSRTLELLDIQGCVDKFLAVGMRGDGARIFAGGRELVHVAFDRTRTTYNYALFVPQNETERLLEEELARLGVTVEREVELTSFEPDPSGVRATLHHIAGNREEKVHAPYICACDGAHSTVRHELKLEFAGSTEPSSWMLADVMISGDLPAEVTVCWQEDGIMVFFPIVPGRFRVIADIAKPSESGTPTLAEVQALIDRRGPPGLRAHDPFWLNYFHINERKLKDYRVGPVFLAGDAAHVHSPAGGQGMNTGMQDAINLAWKLALVWRGAAKPSLLDSYSPERSMIGEQVLQNAGRMTHVAILRNPILQQLRNAATEVLGHVPGLRQRLADQLCELDLHYEESALTADAPRHAAHPAPGHRVPDCAVMTPDGEAARLHERLRRGKFLALSVGAPALTLPQPLGAIAETARMDPAEPYEAGFCYLIRPDAYLATSTRASAPQPLFDYLEAIVVAI
jgi:2-polyprenyl-6-methoxyphenol hydroxylase-like FAD-dependent oxidoreductase